MSYDFDTLPQACDHKVNAERLVLSDDNRSLYCLEDYTHYLRGAVYNLSSVELRVNGIRVGPFHTIYGWEILPDDYAVAGESRYKIRFRNPVRFRSVLIEASYLTLAAFCKKCHGTKLVQDFTQNRAGSLKRVSKRKKLVQRCLKSILTSRCPFYPTMTCGLRDYVGKKWGFEPSQEDVSFEVNRALGVVQSIQQTQARFQILDPEERLRSVDTVVAQVDPDNPLMLRVGVRISSPAGKSDTIDLALRM